MQYLIPTLIVIASLLAGGSIAGQGAHSHNESVMQTVIPSRILMHSNQD